MTYTEAIQAIELLSKRKKLSPMYLRIDRLLLLFKELGIDPELPSVHIAGTSGKGSTSSICAGVLREAGYRVGLHTSPHLQTPRERMVVNSTMPTEQEFADLVAEVCEAAVKVETEHSYGCLNGHDIIFTVSMLHFTKQRVDIAVIETSMGGQFDSTNVIRPLVSVITNVDLDHTRVLGKTVEAIAMVKAGVIKAQTPFITGSSQRSVIEIFRRRCRDLGSECIVTGEDNRYRSRLLGQRGSILSARVLNHLFANLHLKLLGKHQIRNALLVLYIIQVLRSRGWLIADVAIREGFAQAFIPGRLEIIQESPSVILDGAHNPAKAKALADSLKKIFPNEMAIFVLGVKKGKDAEKIVKAISPLAKKVIVTTLPGEKGQKPAKIVHYVKELGIPAVIRLNPKDAIELAKKQAKDHMYVCVTGSLYLVGTIRNYWYPQNEGDLHSLHSTEPYIAPGEPFSLAGVRSKHER